MAKRKVKNARAAKDARQKKIAIGGAVLLLAVLAFQVPRTMKMLNGAEASTAAPAPVQTAPGGGPTTLEPPSLAGGAGGAAPVAAEAATDGGAGGLVSFGRFESKDPFRPQVSASALAAGEQNPAADAAEAAAAAAEAAGQGASLPTLTTPPAPTQSLPVNTSSAVISVNGTSETVAVGAEFPAAEPTFKLVSLTAKAAKIGVAGGSYASGDPTVTLKRGKTLTLMNTSDGRRYELTWLPDSAAPAPAQAPAQAPAAAPTGS